MKYLPGPVEQWKRVVIDGRQYDYFVSDAGRIKNKKGQILRPWLRGQRKGTYPAVRLCGYIRQKTIDVHRLVALHFVDNPKNKPEVNHLDCDPNNPAAHNLEWCTRSENERHKYFMEAMEDIAI